MCGANIGGKSSGKFLGVVFGDYVWQLRIVLGIVLTVVAIRVFEKDCENLVWC